MVKQSKRYSSFKKVQYDQARRKAKKALDYDVISVYENDILSRNIATQLQSDTPWLPTLDTLNQIAERTGDGARIRYRKTLKDNISGLLDLGIQHTIMDYLYEMPRVRKVIDTIPAKFTSFGSNYQSLTEFIQPESVLTQVAEFNKFEDLSKKEQDAIRRAEEELYRISYSLEELEDRGLLSIKEGKQFRTQRMSYEERYRFLYLLRSIDNFKKKAEASKYSFISDTYMDRRQGVLVEDFGGKYDSYIREKISAFLKEESRYISSLQNREATMDDLRRAIQGKLREYDKNVSKLKKKALDTKRSEYENRAERIIATEVSTAYNFGKLIGFSGEQDLEKEFVWNADWELEFSSKGYEVCKACSDMDGKKFTVRDLLVIGTQLDVGAGGFGKSRYRTDFKNPTLPMVPFHVYCNCYFTLVQDDRRFDSEEIYEDIPIESVQQLDPSRQIIPKVKGNLALQLAGAGLVIGGAFLLSRSNIWNTFASVLSSRNMVRPRDIKYVLQDTVEYIGDEFSDDISDAFVDTVKDVSNSPSQIPVTKIRAI